jgi:hypothetical protein
MNAVKAVDDHLIATYGIGLEDVLCDGCLVGRTDLAMADSVKVLPRLMRSEKEDDGGEYAGYEGMLILDGLWYRFACHIFIDASGACFLADLGQFEAVEWKLRLALSA